MKTLTDDEFKLNSKMNSKIFISRIGIRSHLGLTRYACGVFHDAAGIGEFGGKNR